jgi:hypothetical protein
MADGQTEIATGPNSLEAALAQIVGSDKVRSDDDSRALHSQDIWAAAANTVALVV